MPADMFILVLTLLIALAVVLLILLLRAVSRVESEAKKAELKSAAFERNIELIERLIKNESAQTRSELASSAQMNRNENRDSMKSFTDSMDHRFDSVRMSLESGLKLIRDDSADKLEKIRGTVEEKLQSTLERKLGESYKMVSDRLDQVSKGLGEMTILASNVGDLKRIMSNVSARGAWGETQLGALLEEILAPEQYSRNVAIGAKGSERVEFAIALPGGPDGRPLWLPIDAKFPLEDHQRLVAAREAEDHDGAMEAGKALVGRLKLEAKKIRGKYIDPPNTTEFAILFLPTEGLYAEAARAPGLLDNLRREYFVVVAGPTTLAAILNSFRMGFQTLAIQKRSSDIWKLLGAVRTEFEKFGDRLDRTRKKIREAEECINEIDVRRRSMGKKLRNVDRLEAPEEDNGVSAEAE